MKAEKNWKTGKAEGAMQKYEREQMAKAAEEFKKKQGKTQKDDE
jgi:hypothetical protein